VIIVRVMEATLDDIVGVTAMPYGLMTTGCAVMVTSFVALSVVFGSLFHK
jgi:hypothetical protein